MEEIQESLELWTRLERLREIFLTRETAKGPAPVYWRDDADLRAYDGTFARRIAAKWDAVLDRIEDRLRTTGVRSWFDWGCGSGVASERLLARRLLENVWCWDHSPLARSWTARKLQKLGAGKTEALERDRVSYAGSGILLSHVLNEMTPGDMGRLIDRLSTAEAILWVEAGSKLTSRKLSECRDILLRKNPDFRIVSPCPHHGPCPMIAQAERENDWCHFFADAPSEFHQSGFWREFSRKMGIDLRALPFSVLALVRAPAETKAPSELHRIVGSPRVYKGFLKLQSCHGRYGVQDYVLDRRTDKALYKRFADPPSMPSATFELDENQKKILAGSLCDEAAIDR